MRAAVLTGLETIELQERPEPEAAPGWVVVAVESASLCGTDVHQYDGRITTPILDLTDGAGADIVIETSGFPSSSAMVLDAVRKEGKVAHIGWANDLPPLPVIPIMAKTLTIFGIGGNGGRGQYERALELVRSGRFDLDPLVTHRFSLDDVAEAFATASSKAGGAIKVIVSP